LLAYLHQGFESVALDRIDQVHSLGHHHQPKIQLKHTVEEIHKVGSELHSHHALLNHLKVNIQYLLRICNCFFLWPNLWLVLESLISFLGTPQGYTGEFTIELLLGPPKRLPATAQPQ
jgi:hypothetical protein